MQLPNRPNVNSFSLQFLFFLYLASNVFCEQVICQSKDSFGLENSLSSQSEWGFFFSYALFICQCPDIFLLFFHGDQMYLIAIGSTVLFDQATNPIKDNILFYCSLNVFPTDFEKDKDLTHTSAGAKSICLALSFFL